jgi:hypothetical protein
LKKEGFSDTSVMGGLSRFHQFIETNAPKENVHADDIAALLLFVDHYAGWTIEERKSNVETCLTWLNHQPRETSSRFTQINPENIKAQSPVLLEQQDKALYGPIQSIRGIGEKNSKFYTKLGIQTIYDLLR